MSTPLPHSVTASKAASVAESERMWSRIVLVVAALNCAFQIGWFWRFRIHNINSDGIGYIGVARHLIDGDLKASLHGYWSPLTSWLLAATSMFSRNFTLLGHLLTIASFLFCLPLLYVLTKKLWNSSLAAAFAVLWFSLTRGLIALSVGLILADFVLTACVLAYFIALLEVLGNCRKGAWLLLGTMHSLAFLAKAIAMPWLAISTVFALVLRNRTSLPRLLRSAVFASLVPALVWAGWGSALRTKYGQFTTGFQLRQNLMLDWHRKVTHHPNGNVETFINTTSTYDQYMVAEVPVAKVNAFSLRTPGLMGMIVENERQNIPAALKEILILITPGGALAFAAVLIALLTSRDRHRTQLAFACIVLVNTAALIAAYCMLVFDGRYVIPVAPLFIAIACAALLPAKYTPAAPNIPGWLRATALVLFFASTVFFLSYWASPFRVVDRDFEASCYQVAQLLRNQKASGTLVSIGQGPYPQYGVGWEVSAYVPYFAGWRLVGLNEDLPNADAASAVANDALALNADAVALWGPPSGAVYAKVLAGIRDAAGVVSVSPIHDPTKGNVGVLILFRRSH